MYGAILGDMIGAPYEFDRSKQNKDFDMFNKDIRTAVSLGGDCDTLTCIAGGIAEAFYGVPEDFKKECEERLPEDALKVLHDFSDWI